MVLNGEEELSLADGVGGSWSDGGGVGALIFEIG